MTTVFQLLLKRTFVRQVTRWVLTIALLGGLAAGGYFIWQRFSIPQVTLTDVVEGPVVQAFYATGTLLPHREYPVRANVEGIVVEVLVDKGSPVTKGQKLAQVYVEEFVLAKTQAEADLDLKKQLADSKTSPAALEFDAKIRVAEKQMQIAKAEYDRLAQIREPGARTLTELERVEEMVATARDTIEAIKSAKAAKLLEYERDVKTAQVQLDIAQWNIDQQAIVSPIDGIVLDWPVSTGTRVRVNDLMLTVADVSYDHLVMRTNVDEEDKTRVRIDQPVHMTLYSYPDQVFEGRVRKIYPKADPARRTFEVDVEIVQPDKNFSAGMTGELAFVVDFKDEAVVVPSQAVQGGNVWVVREGQLAKAEVKIGLRSIQRTEIAAGLSPGEQVLISPIGNLQEGQEVRTTWMDPAAAAGLNEETVSINQMMRIR